MPAIRHFHPSDVSTPTSSAATTPTDDDSLLICTCPTNSPPLDRTPILISKTSEKKRVRVRRTKNNNNNNQDHHHIPRPRNAFIIFRSHYINFLKSKHDPDTERPEDPDAKPTTTTSSAEYQQNELSKIAAKVWNNMDPDERKPYSEEARKEKEWHKMMYPDYVYRVPNSSSVTANAEKVKGFKIKVKTGNPSKSKKSPSPPQQERPPSGIEFVNIQPRQWQETPSLQATHVDTVTEHEFVPTECIPPLDLHASHQECQQESDLKPVHCPPQQLTFAVDLSPRSLAYDQYQAYNALSSSSSSGFVFPDEPFPLTYEYGMIDPFVFGSSFFNVPSHGIDEGIQAAIGDSFSYPNSVGPGPVFFPSAVPYPSVDCDLLPLSDKVLPLDFDLDVPGFNFELGEKMMVLEDDDLRCSLATWAGYE